MRGRVSLFTAIVLAGLTVCSSASAATIPPEPISCGEVVSHSIRAANDLSCPEGATGLVVGAGAITIDLAGHSISTPCSSGGCAGVGIDNGAGHDGVTIRNGSISAFARSVLLSDASGNRVARLGGVAASDGIVIEGGSGNVVRSNDLSARGSAIVATGSGGLRIVKNSVRGSIGSAVRVEADGARIARNTLDGSPVGISVSGSRNHIVRNGVTRSGFYNIGVLGGSSNVVAGNLAVAASAGANPGIPEQGDGIFIASAATGTAVSGNTAASNTDDGIFAQSPTTTVTDNLAINNFDLGIDAVAGVIDGGGNRAHGNGNPAQCVNVLCSP
jgi:parallel beta-helix repeat protein